MSVSGNEKKYQTKNAVKKFFIKEFLKKIKVVVGGVEAGSMLDAGCGEGYVLSYLMDGDQNVIGNKTLLNGLDISSEDIERTRKLIGDKNVFVGDICKMPFDDNSYDLVLALEVLEHLVSPEKALEEMQRVTSKYVLISVPMEPLFSYGNLLFGKNVRRLGKDKEHFSFWNKKEIIDIISKYFSVEKVESPFPWTIILAKKRNDNERVDL